MPPKASKCKAPAAAVVQAGEETFDLGPPYGTITGTLTDPWDIVGTKLQVWNSAWDPKLKGKTSSEVRGYIQEFNFPAEGTAAAHQAAAYVVRPVAEEFAYMYDYAFKASLIFRMLTKDQRDRLGADSDEEEEQLLADSAGRGRGSGGGRGRGGSGAAAAALPLDSTRPAAAVADTLRTRSMLSSPSCTARSPRPRKSRRRERARRARARRTRERRRQRVTASCGCRCPRRSIDAT